MNINNEYSTEFEEGQRRARRILLEKGLIPMAVESRDGKGFIMTTWGG